MSASSIAKRAAIGREAPTRDIASPSAEDCQGPVVSGREQLAQRDCQLLGVGVRACRQGGTHSGSLRLHWLCWRVLWPASSDGSCTTALTGLRVRRADDNQRVPPHVALQARTHQHARMRITGHKVMTICISHIRSLLFCTYSAAPFIQERGCHPIGGVTTHEPPLTTSRVPLGQPRPVSLHGHPRLPKDTDALLKREGKKTQS